MKASELMVRDWVHYKIDLGKDGIYEKDIRINNIYGSEVNCELRGYEIISGKSSSNLYPIPLTPEILEKNGWISDNSNDSLHIYNLRHGKVYSTIAISDDGKLSIEVCAEIAKKDKRGRADLVTFARDWCNEFYVHELQHALKLCGSDKEIVV